MDVNDDILSMPKGWIVQYTDGRIITEYDRDGKQTNWRKIPKVGIRCVHLKWNKKHWTLSGKDVYLQKKRGWVASSPGELEPNIQYRYIGYWEGNDRVFYCVDEMTGAMTMVVETISDGTAQ
jgi:hypothetical protein